MDPLLANTATEYVPALALLDALSLRTLVPEPGAAKVACVNDAEIPLGRPVVVKATGALKPPLTATESVVLLLDPAMTERALGDAEA